jgi:hypothetical protein
VRRKKEDKGGVLRVKEGYNPNSSSVGSQIPVFLAFAAGAGAVTVIALNILSAISKHIHKRKNDLAPKSEE